MRKAETDLVRNVADRREPEPKQVKRLPRRAETTKQRHERLLRALGGDRRVKRAFD